MLKKLEQYGSKTIKTSIRGLAVHSQQPGFTECVSKLEELKVRPRNFLEVVILKLNLKTVQSIKKQSRILGPK